MGKRMRIKRDNALVTFMNRIFEVPDSYRNLVSSFGKSDAFIASVLMTVILRQSYMGEFCLLL